MPRLPHRILRYPTPRAITYRCVVEHDFRLFGISQTFALLSGAILADVIGG